MPDRPPTPPASEPAPSPARVAVLLVAFFLSGAAGLVYEVCWIRRASLVFGSTLLATSTVLAVFFLGLALGAEGFGRWSRHIGRPLAAYARLELALAALGLASLPAFGLVDQIYGVLYRTLGEQPALLTASRLALVSLLLLPPTVAMGATLPLFCRHFVREDDRVAGGVGRLYAVNTLGATVGTALAGLVLMPAIGLTASVALAAALNVAAALLVLAARPAAVTGRASAPPAPGAEAPAPARARVTSLLVFLAGFTALGYEVLWTRFLGLVVRNTVFTYTLTLTVVLAGIVIGSALVSRFAGRSGPRPGLFAALQLGAGAVVMALMSLPPPFWRGLPGEFWVYAVLMLPAAVMSGAAFPLAVRLMVDQAAEAGAGVGRVTALNTVGGILGSLVAGFLLLPRLGTGASLWLLTGLSVATGLIALFGLAARPAMRLRLMGAAAALALWLGPPAMLRPRLPEDFLAGSGTLLEAREGAHAYLSVVRDRGILALYLDQWWQGQSTRNHQIMAAHVPALLHPAARRALVVGVGVGQTPSRFLDHGVERLDCVDLEPEVFDIVPRHFAAGWMKDPRVRLLREDGRNFVQHSGGTYDVISIEVGQVFRPGIATFYTADFYRAARARLAPGGVLSQFVSVSMLPPGLLRQVVASFLEVFPASVLWYNSSEMLLLGFAAESVRVDRAAIERRLAAGAVHEDLAFRHWGPPSNALHRPEALFAGYLCGPAGLARLAAGARVYRDDRPTLEYQARRLSLGFEEEDRSIAAIEGALEPLAGVLRPPYPADRAAAIDTLRRANLDQLRAAALLRGLPAVTAPQARLDQLGRALALAPADAAVRRELGLELVRAGRRTEARAELERAVAIDPEDPESLRRLGLWWFDEGRPVEAAALLARAAALRPLAPELHIDLGAALATLGRLREARHHFAEAVRLAPADPMALENLARADAELAGRGRTPMRPPDR